MRNSTTTVVIAAGLVLAAVIVTRTPGQQYGEGGTNGACCLPAGGCADMTETSCTNNGGTFLGDLSFCVSSACVGQLPPPTVTSISTEGFVEGFTMNVFVTRAWSDGQVDVIRYGMGTNPGSCDQSLNPCPPVTIVMGTCTTDINRDGDTGIQDFLTLLGGWGACQ